MKISVGSLLVVAAVVAAFIGAGIAAIQLSDPAHQGSSTLSAAMLAIGALTVFGSAFYLVRPGRSSATD